MALPMMDLISSSGNDFPYAFWVFSVPVFFNGDKIQKLVQILQSLTKFFWVEFTHEKISSRVLGLPLKGAYPSTLDVKSAD
jgi:hypothetical protein